MRVEIWSDIACPWCYIGKARFEKGLAEFAHRDEVEVVHRSFELDPGRAKGQTEQVIDMLATKYGRTREEAASMEANVAANAQAEGLGYRTEGRDHGNTFDIHRLLHLAKARGRQDELLTLAYRANFAEERSVFDDDVLLALAVEAGLDADEARAVLADPRRTPTRSGPTSARRPSWAPTRCRSSCSTGGTGSPGASPPRSSSRRWSRPGRTARSPR
ncbi:hypothetical protein Smic_15840 [Streptomyces microflavus]|uniref:DSBA-like thioredoxin domain-containing protein n=1 Tax=Streptomyces microflavus TaxID=1919 RepID=A0A7J0CL73_STRMI|nr:hypothetical protein Smic_15840 [Streptomyces microflavus]